MMTVVKLRLTLERLLSRPHRGRPDQRGQALSVFVLVAMAAIILVAGLVVDGGQKAVAVSRAESVAAGAARAAANAGAGGTLAAGGSGEVAGAAARTAAQDYLAGAALGPGPTVHGQVAIRGRLVTVTTSATVQTIFLSVIGIDTLTGTGQATARVVPA